MKTMTSKLITTCVLFFLMACGNSKQAMISGNLVKNVKNPGNIKVAVLPFGVKEKVKQQEAEYFRRRVFSSMKRGKYNLVEPFLVDGVLKKNKWDFSHIKKMSPQRLGEALGADAILYGEVSDWSKSYLALHSSITIGAGIKLVDARSGEVLCESDYKKTDYDGILKVPTGIASAVLSPVLFVAKKANQYRLADEVTNEMMAYLLSPGKLKGQKHFEEKTLVASSGKALAEIRETSMPKNRGEEKNVSQADENNVLSELSIPVISSSKEKVEKKPFTPPFSDTIPQITTKTRENDKPALPIQPPKISKDNYTIQVASYPKKNKAEEYAGSFRKDGMEAFISKAKINGKTWYRVQINSFESVVEANRFAMKTINDKDVNYFIARLAPMG